MSAEDRLDKECFDLFPIDNDCSECGERPGTHYIGIDLGYMTTSLGDLFYCESCGIEALVRVRELLPPPKENTDVSTGS